VNKRQVIKDFFSGNYGYADLETEFHTSVHDIRQDKRLMNTLNRLHIRYHLINDKFYDGMLVRYYGAYCCLKDLIITRLSSGNNKEDLDYLDGQFVKEKWI
jgi:hypothetical protein